MPESDLRYRNIADELGLELMQCALDYYHKSEDLDVAFKSISFMKYAKRIAVSQAVKDKCKGTCDAFQRCAEEGLPTEVMEENKAIYGSLKLFEKRSKSIKNSIRLIKECEPDIVSIKEKIGNIHPYYFKISTIIASNALTNVIFEVEKSKKKNIEVLKSTLIEAWRTILYLDKFDLEPKFKEGVYKQNRDSLVDLIDSEGGFDTPSRRLPYPRGWCSNIDVDDVDLRTDEELYQECNDLASLTNYVNKFPHGKHVDEVKNRIVVLSFKKCKSIHDLQNFLEKFPESSFVPKAREAIESLLKEEKKKKQVRSKQEKAISMCKTIDDVIELYLKEKNNDISIERCSLKAYECSKSTEDYKKVISIFGANSMGGRKAEKKVEEIVSQEKENKKKRNKRLKKYLLLVAPLLILLFVYVFWGVAGLATVCTIFAWLFAIIALFCLCTGNVLIAVLAGLCFWGIFKLGNYLKDISYYQMITPTESYQSSILDTETNANSFSNMNSEDSEKSQEQIYYEKYIDNQLKTGDKPYREYYESHIGYNYLEFKKTDSDYVILARRSKTGKVVNHMYIRKNDTARMYLPDGTYYVYFYSGKGWNPYKDVGNVRGGFVSNEQIQKDGPLSLHEQHVVYTLYMEEGGNLEMQETTVEEAL